VLVGSVDNDEKYTDAVEQGEHGEYAESDAEE
jgi:hypothetical protein